MINLAGRKDCDEFIRKELEAARIEIVEADETPNREVPARLTGRLGVFAFWREWYYWVAEGPVPIEIAREIYADPIGKDAVRAGGHCGCPRPDEQCDWYDADGNVLCLDEDGTREPREREFVARRGWEWDGVRYVRSLDDVPDRHGVVDAYHIDTLQGLCLFAETLRSRGLVQSPPGGSPSTT